MHELIEAYIRLRDTIAERKREFEESIRPLQEVKDGLEAVMMGKLDEAGADSASTPAGTVYKVSWWSARVQDWAAVLDYAIEHQRFDLFEQRVSKSVVGEVLDAGGEVPGVVIERGTRVNVRRK